MGKLNRNLSSATLDLLLTSLIEHNKELTMLSDNLRQSIQLLTTRVIQEYALKIVFDVELIIQKIDKLAEEIHRLQGILKKIDSASLEFKASPLLTPAISKTYHTLSEGKLTALEVAEVTGRTRPIEVTYLNQLVKFGLVDKIKKGRNIFFERTRIKISYS